MPGDPLPLAPAAVTMNQTDLPFLPYVAYGRVSLSQWQKNKQDWQKGQIGDIKELAFQGESGAGPGPKAWALTSG